MLTCTPRSIFSSDFKIEGADAGPASASFRFFGEQGEIFLAGATYMVRKHGLLSERWTLERNGEICAEAIKPSGLLRRFEIRSGGKLFALKAQSAMTRTYNVFSSDTVVGTIRPAHFFTRRAFVDCSPSVPGLLQLFAFWLAAITWQRAANSS